MKNTIVRTVSLILAAILLLCAFIGCAKEEKGGAGRGEVTASHTEKQPQTEPAEPTGTGAETAPATAPGTDGTVGTEKQTEDTVPTPPAGKVSRPSDLSAIDAIPQTILPDAVEYGWYGGKTTYDASTGEVTVVWDRSQETIDLLNKYGAIYLKNSDKKVCYLTFDCGYENGVTGQILDVLKEKNAKAIFFVTGAYLDSAGDLVKRMLSEGQLVGTHTNNHRNMATLTSEEFIYEILSNEEKLKAIVPDAPDMIYFRPPEGATNEWALALGRAMGLTTVLWSYHYYDFDVNNQPDPYTSLENAKAALRPGAVYLLHAVSSTNAAILGDLIDFIRAQGYEIRRLDQ